MICRGKAFRSRETVEFEGKLEASLSNDLGNRVGFTFVEMLENTYGSSCDRVESIFFSLLFKFNFQ